MKIKFSPIQGAVILLIFLAVLFRVYGIEYLPGLNPDETWYGVQLQGFLAHENYATRTPSGNLAGPFIMGSLLFFQSIFGYSFSVVKLPSVIAGFITALFGYQALKRLYSENASIVFTLLILVAPPLIAYSRMGWDVSLGLPFCLFTIYFSRINSPALAALALAGAVLCHPTYIFILPLLSFVLGYHFLSKPPILENRWLSLAGLMLALLWIGFIYCFWFPSNGQNALSKNLIVLRLFSFESWKIFFDQFGRLITGVTVYEYITGKLPKTHVTIHLVLFFIVFFPITTYGSYRLLRKKIWADLLLIAGFFASVVSFLLVAGPDSFRPHFDRYGMFLVIPTIWIFSICLAESFAGKRREPVSICVASIISFVWLLSFYYNYFQRIYQHHDDSHWVFRSNHPEPKLHALETVLSDANSSPVSIVVDEFGLYVPLRYLTSMNRSQIRLFAMSDSNYNPDILSKEFEEGSYFVAQVGSKTELLITKLIPPHQIKKWIIKDFAGFPLITVWKKDLTNHP